MFSLEGGIPVFGFKPAVQFSRKPEKVFPRLVSLLGKSFSSSEVLAYQKEFPGIKLEPLEGGGIGLLDEKGKVHNILEIVSYGLGDFKRRVEKEHSTIILKTIFSVRKSLGQSERQWLLKAGELAGFSNLTLINSSTAAFLKYATDLFPTGSSETIMIIDAGAENTDVSLFKASSTAGEEKTPIEATLLGHSWSTELSGNNLTKALSALALGRFEKKTKIASVTARMQAKLWVEAERVKQFLSPNPVADLFIDEFLEGKSLSERITRDEFQEQVQGVVAILPNLVDEVLKKGGKQLQDVAFVFFIGGSSRIPFIREALEKHVGVERLRKRMNDKETVAVGATMEALLKKKVGKSQKILVQEFIGTTIKLVVDEKEEVVFSETDLLGHPKTILLPHVDNFTFEIFLGAETSPLLTCNVSSYPQSEDRRLLGTEITFTTNNGFILFPVECFVLTEALKKEEEKKQEEKKEEEKKQEETKGEEKKQEETKGEEKKQEETKEKKEETKQKKALKLHIKEHYPLLLKEEEAKLKKILSETRKLEEKKLKESRDQNNLQKIVYDVPSFLAENKEFIKEEEKEIIEKEVENSEVLLQDDGWNPLEGRRLLSLFKKTFKKIEKKQVERKGRKEAFEYYFETIKQLVSAIENVLVSQKSLNPKDQIEKFKEELLKEVEEMKTLQGKQEQQSLAEPPLILVAEIRKKALESLKDWKALLDETMKPSPVERPTVTETTPTTEEPSLDKTATATDNQKRQEL